jgi:uncharacterized membrane protein
MTLTVTILLWFAALGCGVLGGVYFAFSAFIMRSFAQIGQAKGVAAMNAINTAILRSLFMPFFVGTALAGLALAVIAALSLRAPGAAAMLAGGVVHVLGMFVVTMVFNVPLNNALDAVDAAAPDAAPLWAKYLRDWTFWNHARTIACIAAAALFTAAIAAR